MVLCCAYGCSNRSDRKAKPGVSFHKFPRDNSLREQWIKNIRRANWKPNVNSSICSEHFSDECLNRTFASGRTEVRENAVPTLFPNYPLHLQPRQNKIRKPAQPRVTVASISMSVEQQCNDQEMYEPPEPSTKEVAVQVSDANKIQELTNSNKHLEWKMKALEDRLHQKTSLIKNIRKQNARLNVRLSLLKSLHKQPKSKKFIDNGKKQNHESEISFDQVEIKKETVETDYTTNGSNLLNEFTIEEQYIDFIEKHEDTRDQNEDIKDYDTLLSDYKKLKNEFENLQQLYTKAIKTEDDMTSIVEFMSTKDVTNTNFMCNKCNFICTSTSYLRDHILRHIKMRN